MAEDDDNDRGRKDNTGRDHKPKDQARNDHAPTSQIGTDRTFGPTPNLGGGSRLRPTQSLETSPSEQKITFKRAQDQPADPRPLAIATGDARHDQELAKDHKVISRKDAENMLGKEKVAKAFYDEPSKEQSRSQPLPRGSVGMPTRAPKSAPSPSLDGGGRKPPGNDRSVSGRDEGPKRPAPDYNARGEKRMAQEFNERSQSRGHTPDGPSRGKSR